MSLYPYVVVSRYCWCVSRLPISCRCFPMLSCHVIPGVFLGCLFHVVVSLRLTDGHVDKRRHVCFWCVSRLPISCRCFPMLSCHVIAGVFLGCLFHVVVSLRLTDGHVDKRRHARRIL